MNRELLFLFISIITFCFSIISIFNAPIINNINKDLIDFSKWGKHNCKFYSDLEDNSELLDDIHKFRKLKNLCERQKAMYNLEYSSLIIDIVLGFITSQLGLINYFKIGGSMEKITGIFGIITGIICFILTLVYICYSTYIFNNDIAYKSLKVITPYSDPGKCVTKLFPNGAKVKLTRNSDDTVNERITPYQYDKEDEAEYIKYKELGEIQYNYNKKFYEINTECQYSTLSTDSNPVYDTSKLCVYLYDDSKTDIKNKNLYDNWLTSIIFSCFIVVFNLVILIFGFLLNKKKDESDLLIPNSETTK